MTQGMKTVFNAKTFQFMKRTLIMLAVASMILGMASCKKDNTDASSIRFTASMEGFDKTSLNGSILSWDNDETITVSTTTGSTVDIATYSATPDENNARIATFEYVSGSLGSIPYKAFYPADITEDGVTVKLPAVQNSQNGELAGYPMYAESNTHNLAFKNLCSVLKLTLKKSGKSVSKIQIVTDKLVNGTFTVDYNGGNPTLTPTNANDHTSIVTMQLASPVAIYDANNNNYTGHDFYIYLPPATGQNSYNYMQIKVFDENGLLFTKSTNIATTFNRSEYNTLSFGENDIFFDAGVLNGKFTVNSSGKKVVFAISNLFQYTSGEHNGQYLFGNYQYEDAIANCTRRFNHNIAHSSSFNITNGGGADRWFNMTDAEWNYLFNFRSTTFIDPNSTNNNKSIRWRHVQITTHDDVVIGGLIVFPDNFHWPLDASKLPNNMRTQSNASTAWNSITLSYADWKVLEDAGCAFLPWTGQIDRSQNPNNNNVVYPEEGFYWTWSNSNLSDYGHALWFDKTMCYFAGNQNKRSVNLFAIRLAKTAPVQQQ